MVVFQSEMVTSVLQALKNKERGAYRHGTNVLIDCWFVKIGLLQGTTRRDRSNRKMIRFELFQFI